MILIELHGFEGEEGRNLKAKIFEILKDEELARRIKVETYFFTESENIRKEKHPYVKISATTTDDRIEVSGVVFEKLHGLCGKKPNFEILYWAGGKYYFCAALSEDSAG
ncbi:MAG TPA: hypothetical protein VMW82_01930 [Candidatus Paceibacterota bacterium]|nr:hypothetical protein [Candidatus Paceibacterota bacterium]